MDDFISRNEAREIIADMRGLCRNDVLCDAMAKINALPSMSAAQEPVEPQEKRDGDYRDLYCGACGRGIVGYVEHLTGKYKKLSDYCRKCGREVKWE